MKAPTQVQQRLKPLHESPPVSSAGFNWVKLAPCLHPSNEAFATTARVADQDVEVDVAGGCFDASGPDTSAVVRRTQPSDSQPVVHSASDSQPEACLEEEEQEQEEEEEEDDDTKKLRRLQRNRASAALSRQRKRTELVQLRAKVSGGRCKLTLD